MALRTAAFLAFFLSGASSLVFQTLWSRLLSHVFGSSSIAISSVVSVFMAGLGLGAFVFGRRADRIRDPLLVYALAETGVGVIALCIPWLVASDGFLSDVNAHLRQNLGAGSAWFMLVRFACIVPILLVPTVLMGSTLPLLARHFVTQQSSAEGASRAVGRLYAVNTFGAVGGVLLSSFVLLPRFGVSTANTVAACTNFLLAALLIALRRRSPVVVAASAHERESDARPAASPLEPALPRRVRRAAALAFACSGFSSLLYEVVWSRALVNTIGGSLYSFALILMTFLVGIAGGSALVPALCGPAPRALRSCTLWAFWLAAIAAAPLIARASWLTATVACGCAWAAMFLLVRASRQSAARTAVLQGEVPPSGMPWEQRTSLWVLCVPIALALASFAYAPDRLARITLTVTCACALFAALLLVLRAQVVFLLVALQIFVPAAIFASDLFADELSLTFASMVAPLYDSLPEHVGTVQGLMFVTAALCILPAALGMGAVFPVTLRAYTASGAHIAQDVGRVYAGNTLGSIAGAWLPGFVLMPAIGMQATLHVGMAVNLAVALMLVLTCATTQANAPAVERRATASLAFALPWLIAALCYFTVRPPEFLAWNISKMTLGAFRISLARDVLDEESWGEPDLVYYRDGLSTTVTVERWGRHYSLKNNGKVDASNGDDMPTQIMVAALPLLMHPAGPRDLDVAIVGFGSGVTVGAALQFPVRGVEVVELESATIEASRFFSDVNHLSYASTEFPYVRAPRLQVIADDGRNYLAASRKHYDVIISEPSNPWLTGVSDLFTADHFRISKRKLKPGGVYCQWAQLYELSPENVKSIYRTFADHFRHVMVFSAEDLSSDTILVGSDAPLTLDLARLRAAFAEAHVAAELARAYVHSPFDVFARTLLASKAEVRRFTAGAPLNTDDNARIELSAPRDLIGFERYKGYLETMYAPSWPYGAFASSLQGFGDGAVASENYAEQALSLLSHGRKREAAALLERARDQAPSARLALASDVYVRLTSTAHAPVPQPAPELALADVPSSLRARLQLLLDVVKSALITGHHARALAALEELPNSLRHDLGREWAYLEAYLRYEVGDPDAAIDLLEDLVRRDDGFVRLHPELHYYLARAHDSLLHFDKAVRNMRVYVETAAARAAAPAPSSGATPLGADVPRSASPGDALALPVPP